MSDLRVCVDATPLLLRSAGVKTYVYYWTQALLREAAGHRLDLFPFLAPPSRFSHEASPLGFWSTWARLAVLHAANIRGNPVLNLLGRRYDVFHASHQLRNPPRNTRLTATIYDMTCWLVPEMHSPANVRVSKRFAETVMRRADALFAISGNTRDDAVRLLRFDPARIHVIYPGVAEPFFSVTTAEADAAKARHGLGKPYALFVGTIEPRKSVGVLLDAWKCLRPAVREEFDLVVVGPSGWGDAAVLARLESGDAGVRYLGYVGEADLPGLTKGAAAFVYPSLYEGFGLPVAQAMACGVPVVTSAASCLPEIAGGGALLADPRSAADVAGCLDRLLTSPSLRAQLAREGELKAREYRWEVCARRSWKVFEEISS